MGLAFQPFSIVFWAIHKLYASKHIPRGEGGGQWSPITTLAKASRGNLTEKGKKARPTPPWMLPSSREGKKRREAVPSTRAMPEETS